MTSEACSGSRCARWGLFYMGKGGGEEDSRGAVSTPAHQGSLWADAPGFSLVPETRHSVCSRP